MFFCLVGFCAFVRFSCFVFVVLPLPLPPLPLPFPPLTSPPLLKRASLVDLLFRFRFCCPRVVAVVLSSLSFLCVVFSIYCSVGFLRSISKIVFVFLLCCLSGTCLVFLCCARCRLSFVFLFLFFLVRVRVSPSRCFPILVFCVLLASCGLYFVFFFLVVVFLFSFALLLAFFMAATGREIERMRECTRPAALYCKRNNASANVVAWRLLGATWEIL